MAQDWYENETIGPIGGGDPGQAWVRNNLSSVVTNIAYVQGGWVTVFEDADMLDLPINRVFEGQIVYVSASHKLYTTKRFPPDGSLPSHSFEPIDFPHEGFNASSGSFLKGTGSIHNNLTFNGNITMSNSLEVEGNLDTDTLTFNGLSFTSTTSTTDVITGNTNFGANASGSAINNEGDTIIYPSDLKHLFTGSLLITGGLTVNNIDITNLGGVNSNYASQSYVDATINSNYASQSYVDSTINSSYASQSYVDATINSNYASQSYVDATINANYASQSYVDSTINSSYASQSYVDATINSNYASQSYVDATINANYASQSYVDSTINSSYASQSYVDATHNDNYISSSDVNTTTTGITELSYDSFIVGTTNTPLTNTTEVPSIANTTGIVIGGNNIDGQYNFNVQKDNTDPWPNAPSHIDGGIPTIPNTIDSSNDTTTRYSHTNDNFNFIFNLGEAKTVSEFRITFAQEDNEYELPENIFIYGKDELFASGEDDGVLLGEGARPGAGGVGLDWSGPSSNPLTLYGIGNQSNLNRTASIAETSLTSSFQYYRVRFQKTPLQDGARIKPTYTQIANITPVIRSTSQGTSISASDGTLHVNTIVTNNLIGTASFANFATTAGSTINALTASYIEGLTNVSLEGVTTNITPSTTALSDPQGDTSEDITQGFSLGTPNLKWKDIYAVNTFFGGIHEINLETKGLNQMQEGTVLSLQNGTMHPCEKEGDPLVMGVVSKGENYPIVLGAEPVLITGKIEEGDYIITSKIKGHGKGVNPQYIYDQQLFGKIIAQAIENGKGESYTIKAMIRKM